MMRSAAKLSYEQAQAAIDGRPDETAAPLLESVLKPLYAAHAVLKIARDAATRSISTCPSASSSSTRTEGRRRRGRSGSRRTA